MNAHETRRAIQELLKVTPDSYFGPVTRAAFEKLTKVPGNLEWSPEKPKNSAAFTSFMPFIFEWEGESYENDPDDPGGATKYGIDQRSHPDVNIRYLTKEQALDIYWKEWLEAGCDQRDTPLAEIFFNCRVNMGLTAAREIEDSSGGNAGTFLDLQEARYRSIAKKPKMGKYLKGWLTRTNAIRKRFQL